MEKEWKWFTTILCVIFRSFLMKSKKKKKKKKCLLVFFVWANVDWQGGREDDFSPQEKKIFPQETSKGMAKKDGMINYDDPDE